VSHGLPGRRELNNAYLALARVKGLSAAIFNPAEVDAAYPEAAVDVLLGRDPGAARWIETVAPVHAVAPKAGAEARGSAAERLAEAVARGDADAAPGLVDEVLRDGMPATSVVAEVLTPALQTLGDAFGRGEVFLPQLIVAADAMKAAVGAVRSHLPAGSSTSAGTAVFATVKGDVHSIGKDICVSLLESQDFRVVDLGVDVPADDIVAAAQGADAVCLSALMTTTLPAMEATVAALRDAAPGLPVLTGGAVVTAEWAASIGAGYAADAPGCVDAVRSAVEGGAR
jgi:5-methyltetrahydrofolate--homocysteine methyltransferase